MRAGSRRGALAATVPAHAFDWDRAVVATLRHSTLPVEPSAAVVLERCGSLGARDRLSLLAQFAAHQAFLQFVGISDRDFEARDWAVVRKRGSDIRLVRIAARVADATSAPSPFVVTQQFAESLGVRLGVLDQAWARVDTVFAEAFARLVTDAAADLQWVRRAAAGGIRSPAAEGLRLLAERTGVFRYEDAEVPEVLARYAGLGAPVRVIVLRGGSPLQRYSALAPLAPDPHALPAAVADSVAAKIAGTPHVFVVADEEAFDESSRAVVTILSRGGIGTWVVPGEGLPLPAGESFVVAPRVETGEALRKRLRGADLDAFTAGPALSAYLLAGELPPPASALPPLHEPAKSYVAALAMLGPRIPRRAAERFLAEFLFTGSLDGLATGDVLALDGDDLVFAGPGVWKEAAALIPAASRPAIARVAATHCQGTRAALLWLEAGEPARTAEALEQARWSSPEEMVADLRAVPLAVLPTAVRIRFGHALVDCGRYREAASVAASDELVLARAERRRGDYATALSRLERVEPSFQSLLLRAEVLRLLDREEEAKDILERCVASSDEDRARLSYERALHGVDVDPPPEHYLAGRLATYRALERGAYDDAAGFAAESHRRARTLAERIDASLDRVFSVFSAGKWEQARVAAVEALREVEETEGDRAAGGILFMLAYLAADAGQWSNATRIVERLRRFYSATHDPLRLAELDLIRAHAAFGRGAFDEARPPARAVFEHRHHHDQIREAAALILDEIDLLRGVLEKPRSTGTSGNAELSRRHTDLVERWRNPSHRPTPNSVGDRDEPVPQRLARFRSALARGDAGEASRLAGELDLVYEPVPTPAEAELRVLRAAATREFPFGGDDFENAWCFATRNRLGQWMTIGSFAADRETLEGRDEDDRDWMVCSDRELLFMQGASSWSEAGRQAVAAIFRTRAEASRLRRLVEQDENARDAGAGSIDGIIGQSGAIREVEALVARVASRDVAVCILGESGTGKELVARAIHRLSTRRQRVFTAVNCAALPETLVESELFGHVRGAFTGADRDRAGLIETTDGGTLFLDEIGELPPIAQAKLLRFLQDGEFRRVGDAANRTADVRVVSATNRRLESAVEDGHFREDLYYRIRGVEIPLPPLRERGGDVLLLAEHFLAAERRKHRAGPAALSHDVEAIFTAYRWPGNVRELQNTIRAAHAMAGERRELEVEHLPERLRNVVPARVPAVGSYQEAVARFKRDLIERSLLEAKGNQNRAASMLRMSRQALAYQIRELGILVRV